MEEDNFSSCCFSDFPLLAFPTSAHTLSIASRSCRLCVLTSPRLPVEPQSGFGCAMCSGRAHLHPQRLYLDPFSPPEASKSSPFMCRGIVVFLHFQSVYAKTNKTGKSMASSMLVDLGLSLSLSLSLLCLANLELFLIGIRGGLGQQVNKNAWPGFCEESRHLCDALQARPVHCKRS